MSDERTAVLVTGAGGPAAVAVIRALRAAGHRVVATDADPLSAGLQLADDGIVTPRYDDPTYVEELARYAEKESATILVSTLAEEVRYLHARIGHLDAAGVAHWLPSVESVQTCIDKWSFALCLLPSAVDHPATGLADLVTVPGPWVVKPRFGRGSRDVHLVDDPDDLAWALRRIEDPIVQTRIPGREFTVDALIDRDGLVAGAVARWRIETRGGISVKGTTFEHAGVLDAVREVVRVVGLEGPVNVQGFVTPDNEVVVIEVNPRFSGALPLSLAAGADLVGEYLRGVCGERVRPERLVARPGVTMVRYFDEVFVG